MTATRSAARWWIVLAGILLLAGTALAFWSFGQKLPKYNLLLITLDTTRADHLGCYGYEHASTPNLDALAKRGVLFENVYTTAPYTLPAHCSIHTGLFPYKHGLFNNGMSHLNLSVPTLAHTLTEAGYATGAFVASYVLDKQFGLDRGFGVYDDTMPPKNPDSHGYPQRTANMVLDSALPWLTQNSKNPFFCWLHFYDPHFDYADHSDIFGDQFRDRPYDGEIGFVDRQLQRVFELLESEKLTEKTMVIVVGDHGEGMGEHLERWHGNMLYNSTLHVPLLIAPPVLTTGSKVATTVSVVDVAATALDCLNVKPPAGFGGRSLKPAFSGSPLAPTECYAASDGVFVEEGWSPLRALIVDDWKYIQTSKPELYNLKDDPKEENNLFDKENDLADKLDAQLTEMESQGVRHETQIIELSGREQKVLDSLGYLGFHKSQQNLQSDEGLPDIKDSAALMYEFQTVQELYWRRQKESAVSRLKSLIEAAPHYMAPHLMAGRVLETEHRLDEAKQVFEHVLQMDPNNKEASARIGRYLAQEGKYAESLHYLNNALDRDAKGNRSVLAAEALPNLMKALESEPNSVELRYVIAKMLRAQHRFAEAIMQMQAAEVIVKRKELIPGSAP